MKKLYFVAALVALVPAQAIAQDETESFSGPRAEIQLGYDTVGLEFTDGVDTVKGDKSGFAYGAEVGYDHDFGKGVIGIYGNGNLASTKACGEVYGLDELCLKTRHQLAAGIRLGVKPTENLLVYGKLGYVDTRLKLTYVDYEGILENYSEKGGRSGIQFGGGVEARVGSRAYLKAEYMRSNYKSFTYDEDEGIRGDLSREQIMAGVGVRF